MKYCTRANVHVDRCATAWLIKRFLDRDAEFVFVEGQTLVADAKPFDMHGVEWGHRGNLCSFEVVAQEVEGDDPALAKLARIIHGADIAADADETLESPGVDALFRGLRRISSSDEETIERGFIVMDALYAAMQLRETS